jgi:hypothetical protein
MDNIQDRIAWNSALNNAVSLVGAMSVLEDDEDTKRKIAQWQAWFYQVLTTRPEPKGVNRAVASEKGRDAAESEAGNETD